MMKLLIADDEEASRRCLAIFLSRHGYLVLEAQDGVEALRLTRRERPAAFIVDQFMPGMDEWECVRALREDSRIAETPVIVLSAENPDDNVHAMARSLGVRDVLPKSFFQVPVLNAVRRALQGADAFEFAISEEDPRRRHLGRISERLAKELSGFAFAMSDILASARLDVSPGREEAFQVVIDQNPMHAALIPSFA